MPYRRRSAPARSSTLITLAGSGDNDGGWLGWPHIAKRSFGFPASRYRPSDAEPGDVPMPIAWAIAWVVAWVVACGDRPLALSGLGER